MKFIPKTTDYTLSPYTGLTRESFVEAAEYLLTGIFQNIHNFSDPVLMPRYETEITYPHKTSSGSLLEIEKKAELFEGLCRSFFLAAPLIHDNPEKTVCGYLLRDYYKNQILRSCIPSEPVYIGHFHYLMQQIGNEDPVRCFQQTVETCALVICLWICKEEIWDTYTKEEQDIIADLLLSFAHSNTVPQNWRLFNMLNMAFLHQNGYPIKKEVMAEHAHAILNYYVGDGWYRDGQAFDYYSCWAFNVYAPLWNLWYGYEHMPTLASRFEDYSNKLMESYYDFFDADGHTNMWGRSNIYRNASTSAFAGNLFLRNSTVNPGHARFICSGSLMQFFDRDDFLKQGIPSIGFYGQFAPLVQGYSCTESPFWLGKAFLCLYFPSDHPFWTATEEKGFFADANHVAIKETTLNGPALCFSNHRQNGETILRSGKIVKSPGDLPAIWNYGKLSYNTKYPWEATPLETNGAVESQQYVIEDLISNQYSYANATFWHGNKDGVLYRRQFFDYHPDTETCWVHAINLADFPVPKGIFRVDRLRLFKTPVAFTLGSYGFPDNNTQVIRKDDANAKAIILKGYDALGNPKQMAMTIYDAWEDIKIARSKGTNPDSEHSVTIYASAKRCIQYDGFASNLFLSQVITKNDHSDFEESELFPISQITYTDDLKLGAYGTITLTLKDGTTKNINFDDMEASLSM